MSSKPMTRAQMRRAEMALANVYKYGPGECYSKAASEFWADVDEININSPRLKWAEVNVCECLEEEQEASMLLSEADRPAGSCNNEDEL